MEFGGSKPDSLQKVNLNVINPKECEDAYSKSNDVNITNKNICYLHSEKGYLSSKKQHFFIAWFLLYKVMIIFKNNDI